MCFVILRAVHYMKYKQIWESWQIFKITYGAMFEMKKNQELSKLIFLSSSSLMLNSSCHMTTKWMLGVCVCVCVSATGHVSKYSTAARQQNANRHSHPNLHLCTALLKWPSHGWYTASSTVILSPVILAVVTGFSAPFFWWRT